MTNKWRVGALRWVPRKPRAPCPRGPGDPNSTETCCEEFLYPVKEPGRRRSTEPSGADPPICSVAGPGPASAFSLRRPRSSPVEIRHRTMACRDCGTHGLSASRIPSSLPTDRRPRNLGLREAPLFQTTQIASRPAAMPPANSIVGLRTQSRRSSQGPLRWPSASLDRS